MASLGKSRYGLKFDYGLPNDDSAGSKTYNGINFNSEDAASDSGKLELIREFMNGGASVVDGVTFGGFASVVAAVNLSVRDLSLTQANSVDLT